MRACVRGRRSGCWLFPALPPPRPVSHQSGLSTRRTLFAHFSVPWPSASLRAARHDPAPSRMSLEGTYLPDVDDQTATPTTCRPGKGPENANPACPGSCGLGWHLPWPTGPTSEISWVPPITMQRCEAQSVRDSLWVAPSRSAPRRC